MKAILVIDMPEKCVDCDLYQWVDIEDYENNLIRCSRKRSKAFSADDDKPSWCPLRPFLLGEELRKFRGTIKDKNTLIGFNMAIAICNKYLGETE